MLHAYRLGEPRIRAMDGQSGAGRRRYKIPCPRKYLIRLKNVPFVVRPLQQRLGLRYKIS
jgi:hypothetical protein